MRILPLLACVACASAPTVSGHPVDLPPRPGDALAQAVHLLDRLAYGPSPADLQAVASLGAAGWISQQLTPDQIDDSAVDGKLRNLATLRMSTAELEAKFVPLQRRERLASEMNRFEMPREVTAELTAARLIRAVESRRQLHEVLLDFWFNHFNVSADKGAVRWMISPYEREALRPHLFGSFRTLLGAVAHHPAMLFYLDNWTSTREGFEAKVGKLGLNENYARELLELHTLGVEGGYAVLAEAVTAQLNPRNLEAVFPGYAGPTRAGLLG